ncbi:hypothetical protein [Cupriavidus necator]
MKRYNMRDVTPYVTVDPDGEWVRYSDHCEAMKRIAGSAQSLASTASAILAAAPVAQGLTDAAAFIERKAEEYAREFGYSDMGCLSFGSGDHAQAKMDHYTTLTELADEVRALAQSAPTEPLQGTQEPVAYECVHCETSRKVYGVEPSKDLCECVCGDTAAQCVTHRQDGPCFVREQPSYDQYFNDDAAAPAPVGCETRDPAELTEVHEVSSCCGRRECGGECGNDWFGVASRLDLDAIERNANAGLCNGSTVLALVAEVRALLTASPAALTDEQINRAATAMHAARREFARKNGASDFDVEFDALPDSIKEVDRALARAALAASQADKEKGASYD